MLEKNRVSVLYGVRLFFHTTKTTTMASLDLRPSGRLPALDFWRGFYLLMIYINHVPDNPLSFLMLRNWGFADSAEAFIFISGFSAALAFGPFFETGGLRAGLFRIGKRAWQLFCAHLLLVFGLSAMIAVAADFVDSKQIMEQLNFSPFFIETDVAIVKLLKLGYMPNLTDILPLYIVFVLFFPFAWFLGRLSSLLALGFSFALWFWANASGLSVPNYPDGAVWFFNPVAWQLAFVGGMTAYRERERLARLIRRKDVLALSVLILVASFIAAAPWAKIEGLQNARIIPSAWLALDNKMNLSWIRIVHFLALAVVGTRLVSAKAAFWKNAAVKSVSLCGRHSLAIFCAGTGLSLFVHMLLLKTGAYAAKATLIVAFGVFGLLFLAWALEKTKRLLDATEEKVRRSKKEASASTVSG